MSYSEALTRSHGNKLKNNSLFPPLQQQHRQQQSKQLQSKRRVNSAETDSEEPALSMPYSVSSNSPPTTGLSNLERLVETVTPFVRAQLLFCEPRMKGWQTNEASVHPYFSLGDLWESFREWSVYGVGSPVLLMDGDCVKQYFAPYLSGIQLYLDPNKLRKTSGDSDAGSSRGTSTGSSDCVAEKRATSAADGAWNQHTLMNINSQRMSTLTLEDGRPMSSSGDETEVGNSSGVLVFQFFEQEPPHVRKPLCDKVSDLASYFPEIKTYRSCDLMPESWVSVAWYPIYSIPPGPTLQNLEASFLTFHSLSTHCRSKIQPQFHESTGRKGYGYDASPKISLPVFGLAFYKLRGSILTPNGESEWQQTNSLFQAAANWLQRLQVNLPDFQFFLSRWR